MTDNKNPHHHKKNGSDMSKAVVKRFNETKHYIDKKDKVIEDRVEVLEALLNKLPDDFRGYLQQK